MDYEKKYKEALERAKRWADGTLMPPDNLPKTVAEVIFPELAESEDERIRKELKEAFEEYGKSMWNGIPTRSILAWLEKQKELFESGRGLYYYDGEKTTYCGYPATEENPYDFAMSQQEEKQKEPLTPLAKALSNFLKNDFEFFARKEWNEAKWNEVMNTQAMELQRLAYLDEQKEQKPSDLPAGFYFIDKNGKKYYTDTLKCGNLKFIANQKEQKPMVSYSANLTELIASVHEEFRTLLKEKGIDYEPKPAYWESAAQLIVDYVKQYLKEQKPSWSEEDKQVVDEIIGSLCDFKNLIIESDSHWVSNPKLKDISREIDWLKSLRPSWKPSEEQMSMLLAVIRDPNNAGAESCHLALESLLEDLNKL